MGVHGLWKLLEASGKPVSLESLEGKVLAIDISIWIYQILQGYQDHHGIPRPNAHLLGLFTRICKLLYYKIKPVFVFDGGVPMLKKNTIALRRKQKFIATNKVQKMKTDLINNLIKHSVVKTVLNKDSKVDQANGTMQKMINMQTNYFKEDMFTLPDMPSTSNVQTYISDDEHNSDTSVDSSPLKQSKWMGNIHSVDVTSSEFKALPADVRYDILTDLKETRKQNSWGRLHEIPQESQEFSGYQLKRLLKRRNVQELLESAEKEIGGKTLTLEELDKLLTEQGINTKGNDVTFRIAADSTTRLIYISDKNTLAKNFVINKSEVDKDDRLQNTNEKVESVAGPSNRAPIVEDINEYELNNSDDDIDIPIHDDFRFITRNMNENALDNDRESEIDMSESLAPLDKKYLNKNMANPALVYLLEYSGLSQNQITNLIKYNKNQNHKKIKTASKNVTKHKKNIFSELIKDKNSAIVKSVLELPENSIKVLKSVESQTMQNACTTNDNMTVDLISSNIESNNFIKDHISLKNNAEALYVDVVSTSNDNMIDEFISTVQTDTSDSDSKDFVEIQDVPTSYMGILQKNIINKENVEVTFKSDEKLENDIFADIFEKDDENENLPINYLEQIQSVTENGEHQMSNLLISEDNNLKINLFDITSEELIMEKTKIKSLERENTQLVENILNDEDKVHDSQNSNILIKKNNVNLLTQDDTFNEENMQEKIAVLPTNEKDLIELKGQLEYEQEELTKGIGKFERQATNISDQIKIEAQELLHLFGIPYIVAPMEAEAQCAYLEQIKLTDGTITDDSDIWLFGSQCVYKNFFNNNRRVLQFHACDIQHHFKLNRNQLIQLALLVGSDYTTGVAGVGPVTALEILAAFPTEGDNILNGLYNFCSWIKEGKPSGKPGLHNKLQNVKLDRDFPSQAVVQAYLFPTVDESKEIFTWSKPNVTLLCNYTRQKFGWIKGKFDDIMIPVLKRMEKSRNQKLLDVYFKTKILPRSIEPTLSKRVQKALYRLDNVDMDVENTDGKSQSKKSKKSNAIQKLNGEEDVDFKMTIHETKSPPNMNTTINKSVETINQRKCTKEYIPQREKDRKCALERKLHAIEILRRSKQGLSKKRKVKCIVRKITKEAELSESDSN